MIQRKTPQAFNGNTKQSSKILLFVYATLTHPKAREHVLHHKTEMLPAILPSYTKIPYQTPEGKQFYTLLKDVDKDLKGDVLEVSTEDWKKLQAWEDQYKPIEVKLDNGKYAYSFKLMPKYEIKLELRK